MSVGDIKSTERGTGARYNDGKPPMELLPLRYLHRSYASHKLLRSEQWAALACLEYLAEWQETGADGALYCAIDAIGALWEEASHVLEYGKRKYAAWNWAKGMPWSVTLGCAVRHLRKVLAGELLDDESGRHHFGHVMCNLIFLLTFMDFYPEGNDLPTVFRTEEKRDAA